MRTSWLNNGAHWTPSAAAAFLFTGMCAVIVVLVVSNVRSVTDNRLRNRDWKLGIGGGLAHSYHLAVSVIMWVEKVQ